MICVMLANGFEEIEAFAPVDILRRAELDVLTVGIGGKTVRGAHGITVAADLSETEVRDKHLSALVLPGGMPGTKHLDASAVVDAALRTAQRNGAYIAAICAAPSVLGKRGYLEGVRAVCFPGFEPELRGAILQPEGLRVVTDGKFITAVGMGAALEFGLALVRVLLGDERAQELRRSVLAD